MVTFCPMPVMFPPATISLPRTSKSLPAAILTLPLTLPIRVPVWVTLLSLAQSFCSLVPYEIPTPPDEPRPVLVSSWNERVSLTLCVESIRKS
ncbi:hypothetical protein PCE31106_00003 [Pandoraea cepalis]|uniref:Uncharacterized protein n=1 Tax=Pandoraea cepalis TaxID=2508294 RepID=A0A5E4R918_9BURK|nr:hypothetical protein PCE31106_00003 [Pandoraea cepalis]